MFPRRANHNKVQSPPARKAHVPPRRSGEHRPVEHHLPERELFVETENRSYRNLSVGMKVTMVLVGFIVAVLGSIALCGLANLSIPTGHSAVLDEKVARQSP